jgi:hypothetical protein
MDRKKENEEESESERISITTLYHSLKLLKKSLQGLGLRYVLKVSPPLNYKVHTDYSVVLNNPIHT